MDELERKLRSALTEMAEEVSPSRNAWSEQERRLALKSRRNRLRPALMAAVAAVVAALIAVPVAVLNVRTEQVDAGTVPLPEETRPKAEVQPDGRVKKIPYRAENGETLTGGPLVAGSKEDLSSKQPILIFAYTVRSAGGQSSLCFAANVDGKEINGPEQVQYGAPSCIPITRPKSGFFWGAGSAPTTTNIGSTYVYVMSKPADNLLLRDVNGQLIAAQQKSFDEDFTLFVAYMDSKQPAKAWTVTDATDKVLQHGP